MREISVLVALSAALLLAGCSEIPRQGAAGPPDLPDRKAWRVSRDLPAPRVLRGPPVLRARRARPDCKVLPGPQGVRGEIGPPGAPGAKASAVRRVLPVPRAKRVPLELPDR